ncbi:hypothetical protein NC653_027688 [Populus alba x Populus x berolinensis]|uniref:Uncharacterized protein n=1 Tax=Populus alba x Populus x berolinensis TaxID=444605 RepID=A0AAD6Q558_9ROSI|nr:hypothetical protein NC653_027688 [Populus alba x Populus x berolinensis]
MMSAASFTTTLIPSPTISTSPSFPCKTTKLSTSCFSFNNNVLKTTLKPSSLSTCRVFAAPEALDSQATLDPLPDILDGPDSDTFQVGDSETSSHQSVSIAADADMVYISICLIVLDVFTECRKLMSLCLLGYSELVLLLLLYYYLGYQN